MSLTIREIKRAVARYYDVTVSEMDSPRRAVPIVRARHVAMHLCRMFTRRSYPEIGAAFGGKDHTTVLHACNKMASRLENDRTLAIEVSGQGIRVNSVCPAGMLTHYAGLDPDSPHKDKILEGMGKAHPLGRAIEPGDTATAAMFLASDLASNITGVNLPVDGGLTAGRKIGG